MPTTVSPPFTIVATSFLKTQLSRLALPFFDTCERVAHLSNEYAESDAGAVQC
jgi:hypothetical protein